MQSMSNILVLHYEVRCSSVGYKAFFWFNKNAMVNRCEANNTSQIMLKKSTFLREIVKRDYSIQRDMVRNVKTVD